MSARYVEFSYRKGKPFAAYLYLPRMSGDRSARTERFGESLILDFASDGRAIGIEIIHPEAITSTIECLRPSGAGAGPGVTLGGPGGATPDHGFHPWLHSIIPPG